MSQPVDGYLIPQNPSDPREIEAANACVAAMAEKGKIVQVVGPDEFFCECCREVFFRGRKNEEEQLAEMRDNFGDLPPEDRAEVCDDCFKKMQAVDPNLKSNCN